MLRRGRAKARPYNTEMDFSLNDHQKLIRDTVRQFMDAEVRPSVSRAV